MTRLLSLTNFTVTPDGEKHRIVAREGGNEVKELKPAALRHRQQDFIYPSRPTRQGQIKDHIPLNTSVEYDLNLFANASPKLKSSEVLQAPTRGTRL